MSTPELGDVVVFVGPRGLKQNALVLCVRPNSEGTRIDLVVVTGPGSHTTHWNVPHRLPPAVVGSWFWPNELGFES